MSTLPDAVCAALREAFGAEPVFVRSIGGGMINEAACVDVGGTRCFVKWKANAPPAFFEVEARGLDRLRAAGAIRVPQVIARGEKNDGAPGYLILEWIDSTSSTDGYEFLASVGRGIAALHRHTGEAFGLDHDNYIGILNQRNLPAASWPEFYRDRRVAVQMAIARGLGFLPPHRERLIRDVMDRIETILGESTNPPSLLHGDLWLGNFLNPASGGPALVDPAAHYGDREVEIAYSEMFSGIPAGFSEAYREAYPLDPGYEYRRPLLQLSPMLVHLNHFGEDTPEKYGVGVETICKFYLG